MARPTVAPPRYRIITPEARQSMKIAREQPTVLPWVAGLLLFSVLAWGVIELLRVGDVVEIEAVDAGETR